MGKTTDRIEDIWQSCYDSSYWKNGPVLNNAISGIDQALWDIKGRQAGCRCTNWPAASAARRPMPTRMPTAPSTQAGGRKREALHGAGLPPCARAGGHPRDGRLRQRAQREHTTCSSALHRQAGLRAGLQSRRALKLFEVCRKELGEEVELLHDMHERLTPNQAVQFCKDAEKFNMFFMEDPLSPEDIAYFRQIRQQCATPIAMGELFNSPHEWTAADRANA